MNNSCEFCSKIYSITEAEKWKNTILDYDSTTPGVICANRNGVYELWSECDDSYYTGHVLDIQYCPICGRGFARCL